MCFIVCVLLEDIVYVNQWALVVGTNSTLLSSSKEQRCSIAEDPYSVRVPALYRIVSLYHCYCVFNYFML